MPLECKQLNLIDSTFNSNEIDEFLFFFSTSTFSFFFFSRTISRCVIGDSSMVRMTSICKSNWRSRKGEWNDFPSFLLFPSLHSYYSCNETRKLGLSGWNNFFFFFLVRIRGVERKSGWPTGGKDEALFEAGPPFKKGLNKGTFGWEEYRNSIAKDTVVLRM